MLVVVYFKLVLNFLVFRIVLEIAGDI
jgi:hypothetical protein